MSLIGRHFMRPAIVGLGRLDVRVEVLAHRRGIEERIMRELRQFAIMVVRSAVLDEHVAVRAVVTYPSDQAAPADVLTLEALEIDPAAIPHVDGFSLLPGGGEKQGEDEGDTGHDGLLPSRRNSGSTV